jgi:hypothetical protein
MCADEGKNREKTNSSLNANGKNRLPWKINDHRHRRWLSFGINIDKAHEEGLHIK